MLAAPADQVAVKSFVPLSRKIIVRGGAQVRVLAGNMPIVPNEATRVCSQGIGKVRVELGPEPFRSGIKIIDGKEMHLGN